MRALRDRETSHGSPRCTNGTLGRDEHIGLQCGETSHESPRCTNGTLGRDGHMGLQCGPYGTERHPMGVPGVYTNGTLGRDEHIGLQCGPYGTERHPMRFPGVPMVHWDRMDTWDCHMGQIDIPWESHVSTPMVHWGRAV